MKHFLFLFLIITIPSCAQELTSLQLLEKAIEKHDPNGNWTAFKGDFQVTMTTPNKPDRVSDLKINLPKDRFELTASRDSMITSYIVDKGHAFVEKKDLRSPKTILVNTEADVNRAAFMKDYYTYLYGLPMKLKDKGTIISDKVERKSFKGTEYLVLQVSYDPKVGSDIWFFYFDPETYQMEVYQFFKTDEKGTLDPKSGEYILLSDSYLINDINMPKVRNWYYNKNDQFLGADVITK